MAADMRTFFASRIPTLARVTSITDQQLADDVNRGPLHRFFVMWDVAWGVWGGPEPYTTISARCAMNLLAAQAKDGLTWQNTAPLWALALGWFLEYIDPGHLQGAMIADVSRQIAGAQYLTGIRLLTPKG